MNRKLYFTIKSLFPVFTFILSLLTVRGQNGAEIKLALDKLNVVGSVLYIAAHPDDENTSLISWFANEKLLRTGYLSLTRGDGGQNLIGSEKGEMLGVLRTQELLAARKIDNGEQFFTRAIDFGYSKTSDETMRNWNREFLLYDIVKVIRQFRPDIIITRFSFTDGGHGHHLASAILAVEAFNASADPNRFPDQLNELEPWQAKRIVWNTWRPSEKATSLEVAGFNTLLGKSYAEMAAESRSMHKCQGFGASPRRGSRVEEFEHLAGVEASDNIFEDLNFTWDRVSGSEAVQKLLKDIMTGYNINKPSESVPALVKLYKELGRLKQSKWAAYKKKKVEELIKHCSGLWMESVVNDPWAARGKNVLVKSTILNRSDLAITLEKINTLYSEKDSLVEQVLNYNKPVTVDLTSRIPSNADYSQPYWLEQKSDGVMFAVPKPEYIGKPENGSAIKTRFELTIEGDTFFYEVPVTYKFNDAVKGEVHQPFVILPEISLKIEQPNYIFADGKINEVLVSIEAKENNLAGTLHIDAPENWNVSPESLEFNLEDKGDNISIPVRVSAGQGAECGNLKVKALMSNKTFDKEVIEIEYDHIPKQIVLQEAAANLVKLDINYKPGLIGYIMGSGDEIPDLLSQLGYTVEQLSDEDLDTKDLSVYSTIICGIRAFNTRERLTTQQKRLIEYVEGGGTWLVQHNTRFGKQTEQIGPYPFTVTGRSRIAEETAAITILKKDHPAMNYPNKITEADFRGWIQERGLYFADEWDENFTPLLSGHDSGESAKEGGLLYSTYGRGVFIFSGYSFFRELPAGVPGAYRLFINLISAGGK